MNNTYLIAGGVLVLVLLAAFTFSPTASHMTPSQLATTTATTTIVTTTIGTTTAQVCTADAKICPDGTAVGRTGPNCAFAACPVPQPQTSGVRGTVLLGPTCPVMRDPPDPQCADKPYATSIVVHRTGSAAIVASGKSDASGVFQFSLPPGNYTLTTSGGTTLPRCADANVTVVAGSMSHVTVACDTGIR